MITPLLSHAVWATKKDPKSPNFHALHSLCKLQVIIVFCFLFFFNLIIAFKYALAISRRQMGLFILAVKEHPFSSTYFLKYIKRFKFRYLKLPLDGTLLKHLPFQKPFCSLPFHMPFSTSPDKIAQSKFQLKCLMVFTLSSNC